MTEAESSTPPRRRSRWVLMIAVLGAALLLGGGWWLASLFQSSAQQEANAKAPSAAPVFATVTQGTLAKQFAFTGQVGPSSSTQISFQAANGATVSVVTGHPVDVGTTVSSGSVLTEVNGRPVFGVQSPFAFYRDMGFGDHGPDVTQLQTMLEAQGFSVTVDGQFGAETADAVKSLYNDSGYTVQLRARASTSSAGSGTSANSSGNSGGASATDQNPASPSNAGGAQAQTATTATPVQDPVMPMAEIVAMPSASAQVLQGTIVGTHVAISGTPDLILGTTDPVVTVTATASELGDVTKGDVAKLSFAGADILGVVGDVTNASDSKDTGANRGAGAGTQPNSPQGGSNTGAAPDQSSKLTFVVFPKSALPSTPKTGTARVIVTKQVIAQSDALLVPVLAVADRGGSTKVVTKHRKDGTLVEVPVTVLGTLQGQVAVAPSSAGGLGPGDEVRVG